MSMGKTCLWVTASLSLSLAAPLSAEPPTTSPAPPVGPPLGMPVPLPLELSGCWELVDGERHVTEVWFSPSANRMIGVSETRDSGTSVAWEFLRIEREGASLVFRALPSGQAPAEFPLLSSSGGEFVFENLQHDFPQRVVYPVPVGTELRARIEGPSQSGETRVIPFTYHRIDCGSLWMGLTVNEIPD